MGQATVDLPDPMEKPPLGTGSPGADELLAALAGDEIDRLLAEADVGREPLGPADGLGADPALSLSPQFTPRDLEPQTPTDTVLNQIAPAEDMAITADGAAAAATATPVTPDVVDEETARQMDALFAQLTADDGAAAPTPPTITTAPPSPDEPPTAAEQVLPSPADEPEIRPADPPQVTTAAEPAQPQDDVSRQLDALFSELTAQAAVAPAVVPKEIVTDLIQSRVEIPVADPSAVEPSQSMPELDAALDDLFKELSVPLPEEVALVAKQAAKQPETPAPVDPAGQTSALERQVLAADEALADEALAVAARERESTPLHVKLLLWINAPLINCSDATRELMARVGVVTLVNALAVLAYVLIFRRH